MTTKHKTAPRKAEATPSLRERAERLRDAAGRFIRRKPVEPAQVAPEDVLVAAAASPDLVRMVAEWVKLTEMQDSGALSDEEADGISPEWSRLHGEICRFPARSLEDLTAKAPLYRYERDDERASCKGELTMPLRAWESVVQDIEKLGAARRFAPAVDPILAAIARTRELHRTRTNALAVDLPAGTIDPTPEQNAATNAFFAHVDDVLLKTVPTTAVGCATLAGFTVEFLEAEGYSLDEDHANEQHVRILDLIARSPLRHDASERNVGTDPVFSAITRYQAARSAWDAYCDRIEQEGWDALGGFETASTEEVRLGRVSSDFATGVLAAEPTTEAGRFALAAWIEEWVSDHGNTDGSPQDGSKTVFGEVYPALLNALRVSVNGRG